MMMKSFFIAFFLCFVCIFLVYAEETKVVSEVVSVNPEHGFFIIKSGQDEGIEIDDMVKVYRNGKVIAEGHVIDVRAGVSAAEVSTTEKGEVVQEGDSVSIEKGTDVQEKTFTRPKKQLEGRDGIISITIDRDSDLVFSCAVLVLRENGYSISFSNRSTGVLLAIKPIQISFMESLWSVVSVAIDHKLVVSFDIKGKGNGARVRVSSFREHSQKGKTVKKAVVKNSKYYRDIVALVSKIKERSEY